VPRRGGHKFSEWVGNGGDWSVTCWITAIIGKGIRVDGAAPIRGGRALSRGKCRGWSVW